MKFNNLSDVDILEMQYSLLEELKQKKQSIFPKQPLAQPKNIALVLDKIDEKKTQLTSVRITKSARDIIEDSKYSYSDAIEYFAQIISSEEKQTPPHYEENVPFVDSTKKEVTRDSKEYIRFRESVLKRDGVCQCCGSKEELEVHHSLPFSQYNSLGADTNNGITLCKECHREYHSQYGYKRKNNPISLAQFLRDYGMNAQTKLLTEQDLEDGKELAMSLIRRIKSEFGEPCDISSLVEELDINEFNEIQSRQIIEELIRKGLCFKPKIGVIEIVD